MLGRLTIFAAATLALASCGGAPGRQQIRAVGSSTVYPFTQAVAEAFVNADHGRKTPVVESIGTGAGIKQFCSGVGFDFPDIADASRRMKRSEYDLCQNNRVGDLLEIPIGMDGIAIAEAQNGPKFSLTRKDLYLALAANPMGKPNSAKTWKDVNPSLPAIPIQVYGPPSTSGTRDAFAELIMEAGCLEANPEARALQSGGDPARFEAACRRLRDDGAYIDAGENDNLIVQKLATNPNSVGIFGYSYLEENKDRIRGIPIDGVEPTYESIAMHQYPGARPLYIYVKKRHIKAIPGMQDFLNLYASMWAPDGPLVKRGLIASTKNVRDQALETIQQQTALDPAQLQ